MKTFALAVLLAFSFVGCAAALPEEVQEGLTEFIRDEYEDLDMWTFEGASFELLGSGEPVDSAVDELLCIRATVQRSDHEVFRPVIATRTGRLWEYRYAVEEGDWLRNSCPGDFEDLWLE